MKITKAQLKQIIKEELSGVMLEYVPPPDRYELYGPSGEPNADEKHPFISGVLGAIGDTATYAFNLDDKNQRSTDWKNLKRGAAYVADRIASGGDPADEEAFYNQWRSEQQPVGSVRPIGTGLPSYEEYAAKKARINAPLIAKRDANRQKYGPRSTAEPVRRYAAPNMIPRGTFGAPEEWNPFEGDTE